MHRKPSRGQRTQRRRERALLHAPITRYTRANEEAALLIERGALQARMDRLPADIADEEFGDAVYERDCDLLVVHQQRTLREEVPKC